MTARSCFFSPGSSSAAPYERYAATDRVAVPCAVRIDEPTRACDVTIVRDVRIVRGATRAMEMTAHVAQPARTIT